MKTWIKRSLIGLAVAGTLFGGLAAFAHNSYRSHGWQAMSAEDAAEMKTKVVDRVGKQLDLDAAQKAKLGLLADKMREQRNALVGSTTNPRAEIQSLMAGPVFDRNKATSLIQDKVGAVNSKSPEVVAAMANFYDSLKPEQQAKVREFMAKGGRGKHGGRHGGERGGDGERRGDGGRHGHGGQGG